MDSAVFALFTRYPALAACRPDLERCRDWLIETFAGGHTLLLCGNGGSAADCEHIAGELQKGFLAARRPAATWRQQLVADHGDAGTYLAARLQEGLPAIALTGHPALQTAVSNDLGADLGFAQQVLAMGRAGDLLLGLSTSGNAANVAHAVRVARVRGLRTVGLTGQSGGQLASLCDLTIRVPASETAVVQELHLPVYHWLCASVEKYFHA